MLRLAPGQRPGSARSRLRLVAAAALALVLAAAAAVPAAASDGTDPPPPAVPTGLAAQTSHDAVTLSWDDPGDDTISGYVILRRDKAIHPQGTFETVATNTATAATAYVDLNVRAGRRYVYRIQAINPAGTSDRSSWARAYTPGPRPSPHRPARPTGLSSQASHDTVTLSWDDPGDPAVSGYVILRRDKDIHNRGTFHTINPDTGDADTTYTDTTAEPERRYIYRIKAINTAGYSKISAYHRTDTPPAPEPAPEPDPTQDTTDTDPAADADTGTADLAADTHPDDNDPAADTDTTTSSPPPETPEWVQGLAAAYTSHNGAGSGDALPTPTRLLVRTARRTPPAAAIDMSWDPVEGADGYEVYVLATRDVGGRSRAWWVNAEEDDNILMTPSGVRLSGGRAVTSLFSLDGPNNISPETAPFLPDHFILAVSAYRDTVRPDPNPACIGIDPGITGDDCENIVDREWSHWRAVVVKRECAVWSYNIYNEDFESDNLYDFVGDERPVPGCPNYNPDDY